MTGINQVKGVFIPVPTAFTEDGDLDDALFAEMVEYYIDHGVDALFLMGSFAQGAAMNVEQRIRATTIAVEVANGRLPVVPNVSAVDPFTSCHLAEQARNCGADAIGMIGPHYYNERSADEILRFFVMLDDSVQMPLFIYNSRLHQGYSISPRLMACLKESVPRLFAICPGNEVMLDFLAYQKALGSNVAILGGACYALEAMRLGMVGICHPPFVFAVDTGVALVRAIERGDDLEALRLQLAILRYVQELESLIKMPALGSTNGSWGRFRAGHVEALRYTGFDVKMFPRWPISPIGDEERERLHRCLDEVRAAAPR